MSKIVSVVVTVLLLLGGSGFLLNLTYEHCCKEIEKHQRIVTGTCAADGVELSEVIHSECRLHKLNANMTMRVCMITETSDFIENKLVGYIRGIGLTEQWWQAVIGIVIIYVIPNMIVNMYKTLSETRIHTDVAKNAAKHQLYNAKYIAPPRSSMYAIEDDSVPVLKKHKLQSAEIEESG
jgi:hypothetical protein